MNQDRVYFFDTYIAGRLYGEADLIWPLLKIGQRLKMVREPNNPKDPSAIALYSTIDSTPRKLGYMPFRKNQPLSLFLDMGWSDAFEITISQLNPTATYDRQIGVTLRILQRQIKNE
jgi:hypothetical protein